MGDEPLVRVDKAIELLAQRYTRERSDGLKKAFGGFTEEHGGMSM